MKNTAQRQKHPKVGKITQYVAGKIILYIYTCMYIKNNTFIKTKQQTRDT